MVMVKPGMPYLDIMRDTKERVSTHILLFTFVSFSLG